MVTQYVFSCSNALGLAKRVLRASGSVLLALCLAGSASAAVLALGPSADVRIMNGFSNRGTDSLLGVYQDRDRTLVRFDFSLLPTNAVIRSAELLLWPDTTWFNGGGDAMEVYRVTNSWTEMGATFTSYDDTHAWANTGGDAVGTTGVRFSAPFASVTAKGADTNYSAAWAWDITGLVQGWLGNQFPNQGLMVKQKGTLGDLHFLSRENSVTTQRPLLLVNYDVPGGIPSAYSAPSYRIETRVSGLMLWPNGGQVCLMLWRGPENEWSFTSLGNGYYQISSILTNIAPNQLLTCQANSTNVYLQAGGVSDGNVWMFQDEGEGYVSIKNKLTGLVMTVTPPANWYTPVTLSANAHLDTQKFWVEEIRVNPVHTIAVPVGYEVDAPKRIVLCSTNDQGPSITGALTGLGGTMPLVFNFATSRWGQYYYAYTDRTLARAPGSYTVSAPGFPTNSFVVTDDLYRATPDSLGGKQGITNVLQGFFAWQREPLPQTNMAKVLFAVNGTNVTQTVVGYVAAMPGGWKDATSWDMETRQNAAALRNLAYAAEDAVNPADRAGLLAEVAWGADFLRRLQNPDGSIPIKLVPNEYAYGSNGYVQINVDCPITARSVIGLAAAARVLKGYNDTLAAQCLQAATNGWGWVENNLTNYITDGRIYPSWWWSSADSVLGAAVELAVTAPGSFQADASAFFNEGQFNSSGNWVKKTGSYVRQSDGEDAAIGLSRYYQTLPASNADKANIATQLQTYYSALSSRINLPFGTDSGTFTPGFGQISVYSARAYTFLNAYRALGDGRLLNSAHDYMNWVYGANPFGSSFIIGMGQLNAAPQFSRSRPDSIGEILPGIVSPDNGATISTWYGGGDYQVGEGGIADTSVLPAYMALMDATIVNRSNYATLTWDAAPQSPNAQDGGGTWDNFSANWWNGSTNVVWASLAVASNVVFGAANGVAGSVKLSADAYAESVTFNSPGSGSYTVAGDGASVLSLLGSHTISVAPNQQATIGATLGGGGLTKSGGGTLILSGANAYSGPTVVSNGTLRLASQLAPVAVYSFDNVIGSNVINDGSAGASLNGVLTNGAVLVPGRIGNAVALSNGASVFINSGITGLSGVGTWSIVAWVKTTQSGASLLAKGDNSSWSMYNSVFYLNTVSPGAVRNYLGWINTSSPVNVNDGSWHMVTYTQNAGTTAIYVDGTRCTVTKNDWGISSADKGGKVWLGWSWGNDGSTNLNGLLDEVLIFNTALASDQVLALYKRTASTLDYPIVPTNSALTLAAATASFDLNGLDQTIGSLSGQAGSQVALGSGGNLSVGADNTSTTFAGTITGAGSVNKIGTGAWSLTGANTFTGATTVSGGALVVNGSLGTTATTVAANATLGGSGTLGGPVTVQNGASLIPGQNGLATLTINNALTLQPGSLTGMQLNPAAATNDAVRGLTSVTYGGTLALSNPGAVVSSPGVFKLFSAAAFNGAFDVINWPALASGLAWTNRLGVDGTIAAVSLPPPTLGGPTHLANGGIQFSFSGASGQAYRLWGSTNLALTLGSNSWSLLGSGTFSNGNLSFTDSNATSFPQRFYRITMP